MTGAAARSPGSLLTLTRAIRLLESRRVTSVQLCSYCHELADIGDRPLPTAGQFGSGDDCGGGDGKQQQQRQHRGGKGRSSALPGPGLGLNAFAQLSSRDDLLEIASESDRRRDAGLSLGSLDGIPISVKANVAVEGWGLTAASQILNGWDYGDDGLTSVGGTGGRGRDGTGGAAAAGGCGFDADVVHRLRKNGAILVGTTNMDEFGMGSGGTHALPPRHVRRRRGSSQNGKAPMTEGGFVRNPLPYLQHLVPSFVSNIDHDEYDHHDNDDDLDDLWAHHVTTPLLWRHPDLLHSISHTTPTLSAGGSSSGSAASIALGSSLLSIGTDTGGSVRLPAAWTGVVGFKPTYGLVSRYGLVSYASSLDTVGVLVPTAQDAALVLDVVANRDGGDERSSGERDSTSVSIAVNALVADLMEEKMESRGSKGGDDAERPLQGLTIGIPSAFSVAECPPTIRRAWQNGARRLRDAGAAIRTVSPEIVRPDTVKTSLAAYYVLACAEASSNLARYDGVEFGWDGPDGDDVLQDTKRNNDDDSEKTALSDLNPLESQFSKLRAHGFGPEVIRRILCGTSVLSSDRFHTHFEAAARVRAIMAREFNIAFDNADGSGVDLMLVPTALSLPPDLGGDGSKAPDSTEMLANDVMTVPVSLAGLPSVSVPIRLEEEEEGGGGKGESVYNRGSTTTTVVGLQLFGPRLSEGRVLLAARAIEDGA